MPTVLPLGVIAMTPEDPPELGGRTGFDRLAGDVSVLPTFGTISGKFWMRPVSVPNRPICPQCGTKVLYACDVWPFQYIHPTCSVTLHKYP